VSKQQKDRAAFGSDVWCRRLLVLGRSIQPRGVLFLRLMVTNCSWERSFSRFKRINTELKNHNVSRTGCTTLSIRCISKMTNLGKQILMKSLIILLWRPGLNPFNFLCTLFSLTWFDDCSFLFLNTYFNNDSIREV